MAKLTIIGNPSPVVGKKEMYTISTINDYFQQIIPTQPLLNPQTPIHWGIFVQEKNAWRRTTDNKEGQAVPYTFGQKSLHFKAIKIVAQQGNESGELIIRPQQAKEPKITKVELLDANYLPLPKGKKISYQDTIIARAHCIEMYKRNVSFTLWEDDAKGEGHDPVINMMNKINPVPVMGIVDEYGVAEAVFRLPMYTMAVQIANARIATGETDEGPTHEYYVTAEYVAKHIMKASPNVNVINPTHIPPTPPSKTSSKTPETKPSKPKPKADTPKFPITSSGKKQADPDAKILNAEFLNERAQPIEKAEVGDTVIIKITTQHMKGRNVTVRIWEEETGYKTHDKIYEKKWVLPGNENFIKVPITKKIYELGITPEDMANEKYDYKFQVYFIEVEPDNTHVTSQVIPITKSAKKLEVENNRSVAIIRKPREKELNEKCRSCQIELTVNDLDKFMLASGHGSILNKAPYNTRIPAYINNLNKYMTDFEINKNCYRRANFLGQVAKETKFWSYKEDFIYPSSTLKSKFNNFKTEIGKKYADDWGYKNNKSDVTKEREIKIANWAYARGEKAKDLGNNICLLSNVDDSGQDGYKFRGRGLIQLTGRANYQGFQDWYNKNHNKVGLDVQDFMKDPDLLFKSEYIVLSAIYFWMKNNLNDIADKGISKEIVRKISNVINSGEDEETKAIRYDYVKSAHAMLSEKAPECSFKTKKDIPSEPSKWHDPVDNPQITLHSFNGGYDPDFSSFGGHRGRPHTGLDIFAINKKTKVYACLKGKIVYNGNIPGYGKTIVLKVDKELLEKYKKNYSPKYDKEYTKGNLYDSGQNRYILYAHLDSYEFKDKDVKAGEVIAISGVTGVAEGTHGPHLHIEFTSKELPQKGDGYKYRCNPLYYISLSTENLPLQKQYNRANKSTDKS